MFFFYFKLDQVSWGVFAERGGAPALSGVQLGEIQNVHTKTWSLMDQTPRCTRQNYLRACWCRRQNLIGHFNRISHRPFTNTPFFWCCCFFVLMVPDDFFFKSWTCGWNVDLVDWCNNNHICWAERIPPLQFKLRDGCDLLDCQIDTSTSTSASQAFLMTIPLTEMF